MHWREILWGNLAALVAVKRVLHVLVSNECHRETYAKNRKVRNNYMYQVECTDRLKRVELHITTTCHTVLAQSCIDMVYVAVYTYKQLYLLVSYPGPILSHSCGCCSNVDTIFSSEDKKVWCTPGMSSQNVNSKQTVKTAPQTQHSEHFPLDSFFCNDVLCHRVRNPSCDRQLSAGLNR